MPGESEVLGLLALLLFQDSRRAARTAADGLLVPLDEQDRSRWDAGRIAEGRAALDAAVRAGEVAGPYLVQAQIAGEHARGPDADRRAIVRHYDALSALTPSPFAALARAIAIGASDGPDAGLAELAELRAAGALGGDHYLASAEADLVRRAGRPSEAAVAYRAALELVRNDAERRYLERRLAEVSAPAR